MRKSVFALFVLGALIVSIAGQRIHSSADDHVSTIPDTITAEATDVSGPLMQAKLVTSQRVLEGILNRDFAAIKASARDLSQLAEASQPRRDGDGDDRIYEHFRTEFVRLSTQLEALAEDENPEGVAYAHQNLTATCIACHTHLRDSSTP